MNILKTIYSIVMPHTLFEFHFWGAVAGALISSYSAKKASKAGAKATGSQSYLANTQADIAKEQWSRFQDIYGPVEEALGEEVQEGPDYGKTSTDVARAFDKNRGITERRMGRYGIDPSSGRFAGMEQEYGIQRARGEVDAMNREEDKQFARRLAFTQTGRGIPATAMAGLSRASSSFGNIAEMYNKQATSSGGAAGYWAGKAIDSYKGRESQDYGMDTGSFSDYSYPEGSGTVLQN